jgi:hypothetical protein
MEALIALRTSVWIYPMLEVVHILGIGLLFGNLILIELRVFGFGTALPVKALARLSLTLVGLGFGIAALSGLVMFATQAEELLTNQAFKFKMLILCAIAGNAAWFHARDSLSKLDRTAKLQMLISSVLWIAVVTCGRWIAYR